MEKVIYLARKLKAFTFDEMYLLSEIDKSGLENILTKLAEECRLKKDSQGYIYIEEKPAPVHIKPKKVLKDKYAIFTPELEKVEDKSFYTTVIDFLDSYVSKFCTKNTLRTYRGIFRTHIIPYFQDKTFETINLEDVKDFYTICESKNLSAKRLKNILTLLRQFLNYAKDNGMCNKICNFQVRRLSAKNEFNLNRIVFE